MKRVFRIFLSVLAVSGLVGPAGCSPGGSSSGDSNGSIPLIISVVPDGRGGYAAAVTASSEGAGFRVTYPGVTCYRANHMVYISDVSVSNDGTVLSFRIGSQSSKAIDTLWYRLSISPGAALVTKPRLVNGRGENIFVVGELPPFQDVITSLTVTPPAGGAYLLYFDFLDVRDRVAFSSDRANHGVPNISEIFTINPNGQELFQLTSGSDNVNTTPVWSPGGEWIAFEKLLPQSCTTILNRAQMFIVHPDGSNLTRVSQNMFQASWAAWNPDGRLLAYDCRAECDGAGTAVNICLYNVETGVQSVMIYGTGFEGDQIQVPKWSPDGNYLAAKANDAVERVVQWLYVLVDPLTGDSLAPPTVFIKGNKGRLMDDGNFYRLAPWYFEWAPDSRHAVCNTNYLRWHPGEAKWKPVYTGLVMIDFDQFLQSPTLPIVPDIVKLVRDDALASPNFPSFSKDGSQLWFDDYNNSQNCDLKYIRLNNWEPDPAGNYIPFLADGFYNRVPKLRGTPLPGFFP